MKTIKLGIASFVTCLILGAAVILIAPPQAQSDPYPCRHDCGYLDTCGGPVGSCTYPLFVVNRWYTLANMACDPDEGQGPFNCPTFIGCVSNCF